MNEFKMNDQVVWTCGNHRCEGVIVGYFGLLYIFKCTDGTYPNEGYQFDTFVTAPSALDKKIIRKVGQIYKMFDEKYVVAMPQCNKCCLICIESKDEVGNRWYDPVVVLDKNNISEEEWKKIIGVNGKFKLVE